MRINIQTRTMTYIFYSRQTATILIVIICAYFNKKPINKSILNNLDINIFTTCLVSIPRAYYGRENK